MTDLTLHMQDYLRLRRALGHKLGLEAYGLPQLVAYLGTVGASALTVEHALSWVRLPQDVTAKTLENRLAAVRGFAKYLQTIDPETEVPPLGVFGPRQPRPAPYLWSDEEIRRLLAAARQIQPPLTAATLEALLGLLAVTGMRLGEALGLEHHDVDLVEGVLTIREAKFDRPRLVPIHQSVSTALQAYASCRDQLCPKPSSETFFITADGVSVIGANTRYLFNKITTSIGIRTTTVRPRIHDLRHSFAVRTLTDWHRAGIDVSGRMAVLSTYLGHINPAGTYWYLSATPELMGFAAARLDNRFGGGR